jgi:hypothetical protein
MNIDEILSHSIEMLKPVPVNSRVVLWGDVLILREPLGRILAEKNVKIRWSSDPSCFFPLNTLFFHNQKMAVRCLQVRIRCSQNSVCHLQSLKKKICSPVGLWLKTQRKSVKKHRKNMLALTANIAHGFPWYKYCINHVEIGWPQRTPTCSFPPYPQITKLVAYPRPQATPAGPAPRQHDQRHEPH